MENNLETKDKFKKIDFYDLPEYFIGWCKIIKFFQKEKTKVYKKLSPIISQDEIFKIIITTKTNTYTITMNINRDYLGCTAQRKEPYSGEDWLREMDLPDGKLNLITLNEIMGAIVFYEAEKIDYEKFKLFDLTDVLKKGHIITREKWNFKQYMYYNREKLPQICNEMGSKCYWVPNIEDLEAEDWIDSGFSYTGQDSLINIFGEHHNSQ